METNEQKPKESVDRQRDTGRSWRDILDEVVRQVNEDVAAIREMRSRSSPNLDISDHRFSSGGFVTREEFAALEARVTRLEQLMKVGK